VIKKIKGITTFNLDNILVICSLKSNAKIRVNIDKVIMRERSSISNIGNTIINGQINRIIG
jgi:hypothetical protein